MEPISYLELARQALSRIEEADRLPAAAALASGERLTLAEVAFRSGLEEAEAESQLASLLEQREAFTALDFERRCQVFWLRG